MRKQRKRKPYKAAKEIKRRARILQGQAPPSRRFEDGKKEAASRRERITPDSV